MYNKKIEYTLAKVLQRFAIEMLSAIVTDSFELLSAGVTSQPPPPTATAAHNGGKCAAPLHLSHSTSKSIRTD